MQAEVRGWPTVPVTESPDGTATVETYTVRRDSGRATGIIIGRLTADGTRFLATTEDDELISRLIDGDPLKDLSLVADPAKHFKVIMKDGKIYKNTL